MRLKLAAFGSDPKPLRGDEAGGPRPVVAEEFHADATGGGRTRRSASLPQVLRGDEAGGPRSRAAVEFPAETKAGRTRGSASLPQVLRGDEAGAVRVPTMARDAKEGGAA